MFSKKNWKNEGGIKALLKDLYAFKLSSLVVIANLFCFMVSKSSSCKGNFHWLKVISLEGEKTSILWLRISILHFLHNTQFCSCDADKVFKVFFGTQFSWLWISGIIPFMDHWTKRIILVSWCFFHLSYKWLIYVRFPSFFDLLSFMLLSGTSVSSFHF